MRIRNDDRAVIAGRISRLRRKIPIDVVKEATIRDDIIERSTVWYLFEAGCGHILKGLPEVGGVCQFRNCGAIVCRACASRCSKCGKMLCPEHARAVGGSILCPTCAQFALGFRFISKGFRGAGKI
ncbi:MAG: hypothetical protein QXW77_02970 [Candidatus Hadarchaeales archaeon]